MTAQRSVGKFCSLVVSTLSGTFDSVAVLPSAKLGDGAECYCLANKSAYRYDASSTLSSTQSPYAITALTGGGAWVMMNAAQNAGIQIYGTSLMTGSGGLVPVSNVWKVLPSGANFYSSQFTSGIWSFSTTTGIITYSGPTGKGFNFTADITLEDSVAGTYGEFTLSENAQLIGATTADLGSSASAWSPNGLAGPAAFISYTYSQLGTNGNTYQMIYRCTGQPATSVSVHRYKFQITEL